MRRSVPRRSELERRLAGEFHAAPARRRCAGCGGRAGRWAHHAIPKSLIRARLRSVVASAERLVGLVWDSRNAVPVCDGCHEAHELASRRLPASAVTGAVWEFARELDGLVPGDPFTLYLERTYLGREAA